MIRVNSSITRAGIALVLLLYSTVCFYKLDTQLAFIIMHIVAAVLVLFDPNVFKWLANRFLIWLTCLYALFLLYGLLFLRAGIFNLDRFVISYFQCVLYYLIFKKTLADRDPARKLALAFGLAAVLCIVTLYLNEGSLIGREIRSIGSTLSGNVNTAAMSLGVMTLFITFYYGKTKKPLPLILSVVIMAIMLMTGSKKAIVYIIANVFVLFSFAKNKSVGRIVTLALLALLAYVLFGTEYFYQLIGVRVIDMLGQIGFHIENAHYSYSTEIRMYMIAEAFRIWWHSPIFGGGMNYFQLQTTTIYEYSHCNVLELLCTFGIVGTALYYAPHFAFYHSFKKISKVYKEYAAFALIASILTLTIDWMAVTFSSFAVYYIPVIFLMVLMENYRKAGGVQVGHE